MSRAIKSLIVGKLSNSYIVSVGIIFNFLQIKLKINDLTGLKGILIEHKRPKHQENNLRGIEITKMLKSIEFVEKEVINIQISEADNEKTNP